MIHVVTLEPFEAEVLQPICRALFAAFGVGAEHTGAFKLPEGASGEGGLDAERTALKAESPKTFGDDKILYLVHQPFPPRKSLVGPIPTPGFAEYGGARGVLSAAAVGFGSAGSGEGQEQRLAKLAVHTVGHLFDLHHCVDVRCSMAAPWGQNFLQGQSANLCSFCRDKSERRMKNDAA